ncbi:MAPEG family protein [Yoonia maritima]|uniref:MAPEG family protein n=1 Tax=Yoonia maritima TaxID=1435347 RepID=UPI003736EA05
MLPITAIYGALTALVYLTLTIRVIGQRRALKISLGDKDNPAMRQHIRAHANCAEYAPMGIILLGLVELNGAATWLVHLLGLMVILGRVAHAAAFWKHPMSFPLRQLGMLLTMVQLALASLVILISALF